MTTEVPGPLLTPETQPLEPTSLAIILNRLTNRGYFIDIAVDKPSNRKRTKIIESNFITVAPTFVIDTPQELNSFTKDLFRGIKRDGMHPSGIWYPPYAPDQRYLTYPTVSFTEVLGTIKARTIKLIETDDPSFLVELGLKEKTETTGKNQQIKREIQVTVCPSPEIADLYLKIKNLYYNRWESLPENMKEKLRFISNKVLVTDVNTLKAGQNPFENIFKYLRKILVSHQ